MFFVALGVLAFLSALVAWFFISQAESQEKQKLQSLKEMTEVAPSQEEQTLRGEVASYAVLFEDFAVVAGKRYDYSPYFEFLSNTVHPEVYFTRAAFEGGSSAIPVSARASRLRAIEYQRLIWKTNEHVQEFTMQDIIFGVIAPRIFSAQIALKPEVFSKSAQEQAAVSGDVNEQ